MNFHLTAGNTRCTPPPLPPAPPLSLYALVAQTMRRSLRHLLFCQPWLQCGGEKQNQFTSQRRREPWPRAPSLRECKRPWAESEHALILSMGLTDGMTDDGLFANKHWATPLPLFGAPTGSEGNQPCRACLPPSPPGHLMTRFDLGSHCTKGSPTAVRLTRCSTLASTGVLEALSQPCVFAVYSCELQGSNANRHASGNIVLGPTPERKLTRRA
jgi:hypothetical protein